MPTTIIPLTDARAKIGKLIDELKELKTVFLTKRGRSRAVLVDIEYWKKIKRQLSVLSKDTYIEEDLIAYTREFTDEEIEEWLEEDKL